ncbi:hypothetical protein AU156_gp004 [Edwardsiella phage PEi20]|uniref:Uncharacterized protein n=2 Tax=Kanagawavirus pei20 TaxID=2844109 RepID=A0A0B6VSX1_9CAUD|nr:hypothetical protein AU156_gp004 [Edwardsiella phage PEi20]BAQ22654.1 conserved hypothetical protein [Edwardsiella phage PEi20]BAQ22955.1 conserved hypothetical protein [Edwardsiella phage PEi26]
MKKYWVTLATGEFGYLWATEKPLFSTFVTITVERPDGSIYKAYGQVYRVE